MPRTVAEVMTPAPTVLPHDATAVEAARTMRDNDVGDVLVARDGTLCGIATDRDLVIRALAEGRDPGTVRLGDVCSPSVLSLQPVDPVDVAITTMAEHALRRLPVCVDGNPVGIVSLSDLALVQEPRSALAHIARAPANH